MSNQGPPPLVGRLLWFSCSTSSYPGQTFLLEVQSSPAERGSGKPPEPSGPIPLLFPNAWFTPKWLQVRALRCSKYRLVLGPRTHHPSTWGPLDQVILLAPPEDLTTSQSSSLYIRPPIPPFADLTPQGQVRGRLLVKSPIFFPCNNARPYFLLLLHEYPQTGKLCWISVHYNLFFHPILVPDTLYDVSGLNPDSSSPSSSRIALWCSSTTITFRSLQSGSPPISLEGTSSSSKHPTVPQESTHSPPENLILLPGCAPSERKPLASSGRPTLMASSMMPLCPSPKCISYEGRVTGVIDGLLGLVEVDHRLLLLLSSKHSSSLTLAPPIGSFLLIHHAHPLALPRLPTLPESLFIPDHPSQVLVLISCVATSITLLQSPEDNGYKVCQDAIPVLGLWPRKAAAKLTSFPDQWAIHRFIMLLYMDAEQGAGWNVDSIAQLARGDRMIRLLSWLVGNPEEGALSFSSSSSPSSSIDPKDLFFSHISHLTFDPLPSPHITCPRIKVVAQPYLDKRSTLRAWLDHPLSHTTMTSFILLILFTEGDVIWGMEAGSNQRKREREGRGRRIKVRIQPYGKDLSNLFPALEAQGSVWALRSPRWSHQPSTDAPILWIHWEKDAFLLLPSPSKRESRVKNTLVSPNLLSIPRILLLLKHIFPPRSTPQGKTIPIVGEAWWRVGQGRDRMHRDVLCQIQGRSLRWIPALQEGTIYWVEGGRCSMGRDEDPVVLLFFRNHALFSPVRELEEEARARKQAWIEEWNHPRAGLNSSTYPLSSLLFHGLGDSMGQVIKGRVMRWAWCKSGPTTRHLRLCLGPTGEDARRMPDLRVFIHLPLAHVPPTLHIGVIAILGDVHPRRDPTSGLVYGLAGTWMSYHLEPEPLPSPSSPTPSPLPPPPLLPYISKAFESTSWPREPIRLYTQRILIHHLALSLVCPYCHCIVPGSLGRRGDDRCTCPPNTPLVAQSHEMDMDIVASVEDGSGSLDLHIPSPSILLDLLQQLGSSGLINELKESLYRQGPLLYTLSPSSQTRSVQSTIHTALTTLVSSLSSLKGPHLLLTGLLLPSNDRNGLTGSVVSSHHQIQPRTLGWWDAQCPTMPQSRHTPSLYLLSLQISSASARASHYLSSCS
ncbi:MAG: hypothetical protein DHS80DRAFT_22445 [Piptocephalis tieghemiana]|nr:MAG: hypothetical protein DHS80DRAFT_22445 [Piptocephalis tieghemiana]